MLLNTEKLLEVNLKHLLFILFTFLSLNIAFSQTSSERQIEWGEEYKAPAKSRFVKIIGSDDSYFYTLRLKYGMSADKYEVFVEKFDLANCKLIDVSAVNMKYNGKMRSFHNVLKVKNQMYLITSFLNKGKKKNYLFAQAFNERMKVSDKLIKIGEIDVKNIDREGKFDVEISRDSSKILVYHDLPHKKGKSERLALSVYDSEFQSIWESEVNLPYLDRTFSVEKYEIDNEGNVYLLGVRFFDGIKYRRKGKPNYEYILISYSDQGENRLEHRFTETDKFFTDLTFEPLKNGTVLCSGFYSEKNSYSIKGTFFFRMNIKTEEIFVKSFKEFDFDFLTYQLSDYQKQKAEKAVLRNDKDRAPELYRYSLDDLIIRSDGGVLMVSEQYYVQEFFRDAYNPFYGYRNTLNRNNNVTYLYNYNDILLVNISPEGEIEWTSSIPKNQVTSNDGGYFSSYAKAVVRNNIYFIFNDNVLNYDGSNRSIRDFNGSNAVIALTEVGKNGNSTTKPLSYDRKDKILTRPKVCRQVNPKKMIVYGELANKFRFGHIDF